jgi:hypothetical protein
MKLNILSIATCGNPGLSLSKSMIVSMVFLGHERGTTRERGTQPHFPAMSLLGMAEHDDPSAMWPPLCKA